MKLRSILIAALLATTAYSQTLYPVSPQSDMTRGGGVFVAANYGTWMSRLVTGTTATGAQTVTVSLPTIAMNDGRSIVPFATNTPLLFGAGSTAETVTPSAVSGCVKNQTVNAVCQITATFTYVHGAGELVQSGSYGLQEAINDATLSGGGTVVTDSQWSGQGGTNALILAATPFPNVNIEDDRGGNQTGWSIQPTTLSLLAAPAVLTATTIASGTATGTWTAADTFFCITYVDQLGGEGPCSATYDVTLTVSVAVNVTAGASPASTGAVGWRLYAGTSYASAYLLPITSANCVLSTSENVIPACAIGAAGVFPTANTTTTQLKPAPTTPLQNVNNVVPQGHTTFGYMPTKNPLPFQTDFGPFPAVGTITAGNYAILGSAQLPAGYLNFIGKTLRISGKITATVTTADTFSLQIVLGWAGGDTAGLGLTVCSAAETDAYAATAVNVPFSCTLTTNAIGATAVGTLQPTTWAQAQITGGTIAGINLDDKLTAAVTALGLFSQDTVYVKFGSIAQAASAAQLLDLHIETVL